ncbi:MAG: CDF family Co(II)/Ni(II) efflux transporter DmeF [Rhodospirillaceae bacterium]|nr:CDF family Co(II)/Ni(II) efflux transporter DmeF [Rhodospirillaceae bacterium]
MPARRRTRLDWSWIFIEYTPMHTHSTDAWTHDHSFAQHEKRRGEARTRIVIGLTTVTMAVEIAAGLAYGSMALLADGIHMASHAAALSIAAFAYWYARRHAHDARFSFGTGKVNALAGFASALLLAVFAAMMVWESGQRLVQPVEIAFNQAIVVALVGLAVNGVSALILKPQEHHHHEGHHDGHHEGHDHHHHDHNLKAAYLHVIADALTSILAVAALLGGKVLGWAWLDPAMGLVGAAVILRWSWGLVRDTSGVLLDRQAPAAVREQLRRSVERGTGDRVTDLHLWSIAPGTWAGAITVVSATPQAPGHYKALIDAAVHVEHLTVEVHACGA